MVQIQVENGGQLRGTAHLRGDSHFVAAAQAAALLAANGKVVLDGVNDGAQLQAGNDFLQACGVPVEWNRAQQTLKIAPAGELRCPSAPLTEADRFFIGPLLLRLGRVQLAVAPTARLVQVFTTFGVHAQVHAESGNTELVANHLKGTAVTLRDQDEALTLALMLTACVITGMTIINQPATGTAVIALARLLNRMGGKVHGAGGTVIRIEGVRFLHGGDLRVPGDQAQAGRLALLAALTAGDLLIEGAEARVLNPLLTSLETAGNTIVHQQNGIRVIGTRVPLPTTLDLAAVGMTTTLEAALALAVLAFDHGTGQLTGVNLDALSPALTVWDQLGLHPVVQRPVVTIRGQLTTPVAGPVTGLTEAGAMTWLLVGLRGPAALAVDLPDPLAGKVVDLLTALTDHGVKVVVSAPTVRSQPSTD